MPRHWFVDPDDVGGAYGASLYECTGSSELLGVALGYSDETV
jgi:hypothetical protein